MAETKWTVTFQVLRQKEGQAPHFDAFTLEVDPDEYVLDGVERIWAFEDRSLVFRHACHHSTCGACGMRVNGVEKLTCITPIREVTQNGGTLRVEPLRNFPVISDLAVDMGSLYRNMDLAGALPVNEDGREAIQPEARPAGPENPGEDFLRLADCIECGLCISACPISATAPNYLGPAVLAGLQQHGVRGDPQHFDLANGEDGVWRCHSAFECTAVCPSFVDPGWRIMNLRRQVIGEQFARLFGRSRAAQSQSKERVK
jgi:succinate dehydrogenase / fumarate reductase iron-sulfur subunit